MKTFSEARQEIISKGVKLLEMIERLKVKAVEELKAGNIELAAVYAAQLSMAMQDFLRTEKEFLELEDSVGVAASVAQEGMLN